MEKSTKKKSKKSLLTVILISVMAVILIAMAVIIYLLLNKDKEDQKDYRPTVATEDNIDEVLANMDQPVEDGSYEITMNTEWTFEGKSSNAYVENSTSNTRTVYFDVTLADTDELVYSSPYLPVGEKIQNFALDAKLAPGNYNGLVTYHLVDENNEEVSNLSVTVTFQVK